VLKNEHLIEGLFTHKSGFALGLQVYKTNYFYSLK